MRGKSDESCSVANLSEPLEGIEPTISEVTLVYASQGILKQEEEVCRQGLILPVRLPFRHPHTMRWGAGFEPAMCRFPNRSIPAYRLFMFTKRAEEKSHKDLFGRLLYH